MKNAGNSRAVREARRLASLYRASGYPEAEAAPAYCIDEHESGGFYTYTVCVYVGPKDSSTMKPLYRKLMEKIRGEN